MEKKEKSTKRVTLPTKLKKISVELYNLEFDLTNNNLENDDSKRILLTEVINTRKSIEQLVYLLNKNKIKGATDGE